MTSGNATYRRPRWLPGRHAETIYPVFVRRPRLAYRRERIDTPDGDFVDFDWADGRPGAPLVALFHGLEGNSSSHYARALMHALQSIGWSGVIPHFRGCSGEPNRQPRAYHSGDFAEIAWMMATLHAAAPDVPFCAVGVSLGGSALLNWLGREGSRATEIVRACAAVSTPLDLTASGFAIGQGFNRVYAWHFLQTLKPKAIAMAERFPGKLDTTAISRVDSMYAFDDAVTAPLHGFGSVDDYWARASSKPWLKTVAVPTLVLNARNDPFVPASSLPGSVDVGAAVTLEQPEHGGHVGFLGAPFPGSLAWLPQHLVQFLRAHAIPE